MLCCPLQNRTVLPEPFRDIHVYMQYRLVFIRNRKNIISRSERNKTWMTPANVSVYPNMHGTTVLGLRHRGKVVLGSDGQATMNNVVVKHRAQKVRTLYDGKILAGFAGATADAFTLFERFEEKLQQYGGNVTRSAVELAKDWRTDRYLRRLEALLAVGAPERLLLVSGTGDVIEPDDEIIAIGSGGAYALAATRATLLHANHLEARNIVEQALRITADICIYTNDHLSVLEIDAMDAD